MRINKFATLWEHLNRELPGAQLYIEDIDSIAFAQEREKSAVIVLNRSSLCNMTIDEALAVLYHEIGHIKYRHIRLSRMWGKLGNNTFYMSQFLGLILLYSMALMIPIFITVSYIYAFTYMFIIPLIILFLIKKQHDISFSIEQIADEYAVNKGFGQSMLDTFFRHENSLHDGKIVFFRPSTVMSSYPHQIDSLDWISKAMRQTQHL